jgi:hypothetical protein
MARVDPSLQLLFTIFLFSTCLIKERVLKLVGIHPMIQVE